MTTDTDNRYDSAALEASLMSASRSFSGNSAMGFGTDRDPMGASFIQSSGDLNDIAASILYESSHIVQKIVYLYPLEGADHWLKFTAKSDGEGKEVDTDLQEYLNARSESIADMPIELNQGRLSDIFFEASFNARLAGRAYILLGIEDGREWYEPVDAANIKSLRRMEVLFKWEVMPHRTGNQRYSNPTHYRLNRGYRPGGYDDPKDEPPINGLIHRSRILVFDGLILPERSLMRRGGQGKSVIDSVWRALSRSENSFNAAGYMLQTASLFTYGLKGLSEIKDPVMRKAIESRFLSIMFSMSVLKGIPHDPDQEVVSTLSKQFGGIDAVLRMILEQVALECDVPQAKLFEMSQAGGLNSIGKGESERFLWSQALDGWRKRNWAGHFLYLGKVALLAKDFKGGKEVKGLGVLVPDSLQLSPAEKLEMREQHMTTMDMAIQNKMLTPWEARQSTYGGNQWSFEITLDDRMSKRIEDESLNPPDEFAPIAADPNNPQTTPAPDQPPAGGDPKLEQFDRADDATRPQKKIKWGGFTIGLQYRTGDLRHGKPLHVPYGYFEKTRGADGMALDVYVGPFLNSNKIFAIEQHVNGQFDEHKYVIGVNSVEDAQAIYLSAMPSEFLGSIKEVGLSEIENQRIG